MLRLELHFNKNVCGFDMTESILRVDHIVHQMVTAVKEPTSGLPETYK